MKGQDHTATIKVAEGHSRLLLVNCAAAAGTLFVVMMGKMMMISEMVYSAGTVKIHRTESSRVCFRFARAW